MQGDFRKPLIVMTPKSLLRHKLAVSPVDQLTVGHFHDVVLDDPAAPDRACDGSLVCSGKVYFMTRSPSGPRSAV